MEIRLTKILADAGVSSRRTAETLILSGRVRVNGQAVRLPQSRFDPKEVTVTVDGKRISSVPKKVYYVLHKPLGYICSNKRIKGERLVIDLFKDYPYRLFTAGRLDKETSGLLIITNDGDFSQKVIHPSSDLVKEYVVKSSKEISHEHLVRMSKGVTVDKTLIKPVFVKKVRKGTFKVGVKEGKKHEVRTLAAVAKLNVLELKRIRIGGLQLSTLPYGEFREMTRTEKSYFCPDTP